MDKDVVWNSSCAEGLAEVLLKSITQCIVHVCIFRNVPAFAVDSYNILLFYEIHLAVVYDSSESFE